MTILKHEVRSGLAGCILWSAVTGGLMALCVSMYPSMSGSMDDFSAMFANMGDFSAAFGLDKLEFGSVMGFYGTECGNILGLGGAFYAALTAMGLLAGEEGGHTAEFLLTHPVSRVRAAAEKLAALAVLVLALNAVCLACGAASILAVGETAAWGDLLRYHAALLGMQLEIGGVCFGLSALLRRSSFGLAMGLAAVMYFLGPGDGVAAVCDTLLLCGRGADLRRRGPGGTSGGRVPPGRCRRGVGPVAVRTEGHRGVTGVGHHSFS